MMVRAIMIFLLNCDGAWVGGGANSRASEASEGL